MTFTKLITKILSRQDFESKPPVLVDIGASESIHKNWRSIENYSIGIAFDPDKREYGYIEKAKSNFKKLYVFNCAVSDSENPETDFYLTSSPYCSSMLKPYSDKIKVWSFADKFEIVREVKIKTKRLSDVLSTLGLERIDWYKSDSQGVDLRLFNSLSDKVKRNILAAEFEPGFIDSYVNEDKLSKLISHMEKNNFWISGMTVKGSQRITQTQLNNLYKSSALKKFAQFSHKISPGWAEIIYLNDFQNEFTLREYLLGWIFGTILKQHGFALTIIEEAGKLDNDEATKNLLNKMKKYSIKRIKMNVYKLKFLPAVIERLSKMLSH